MRLFKSCIREWTRRGHCHIANACLQLNLFLGTVQSSSMRQGYKQAKLGKIHYITELLCRHLSPILSCHFTIASDSPRLPITALSQIRSEKQASNQKLYQKTATYVGSWGEGAQELMLRAKSWGPRHIRKHLVCLGFFLPENECLQYDMHWLPKEV